VTLKSGGYIIINQTEALVAVDVNSGRSTREHSIEETALQTNLEAAEEVARQLRLRDLAGLIVIDFIDMEEKRNNRLVEKRLKDHLKNDRARIQVGRISHFGLLEMSRQRIRASVLESTMQVCSHCGGTGHVRSQSSVALHVLRGVEEFLLKSTTHDIIVHTQPDIALYLLNQKRASIVDYEGRFGVSITIAADASVGAQHFTIERGEAVENPVKVEQLIAFPVEEEEEDIPVIEEEDEEEEAKPAASGQQPSATRDENGSRKKKRRRRRRGSSRGAEGDTLQAGDGTISSVSEDVEDDDGDEGDADGAEAGDMQAASAADSDGRRRRRRGKRGGRRNREEGAAADMSEEDAEGAVQPADTESSAAVELTPDSEAGDRDSAAPEVAAEAPRKRRSRKGQAKDQAVEQPTTAETAPAEPEVAEEPAVEEPAADEAEAPARRRTNRGEAAIAASKPVVVSSSSTTAPEDDQGKPKKAGWWQKRGFL
jgi:ribonuclease E